MTRTNPTNSSTRKLPPVFHDEEDVTMTVDRMLMSHRSASHRSLPMTRATPPTPRTRRTDLSQDLDQKDDGPRTSGKTTTTAGGDTTTTTTTTSKGSNKEPVLTRTNSARSFGSWTSFKTPLRSRSGNLLRSMLPSFITPPAMVVDTDGNPIDVVEELDDLKSVDSVDMEPALTEDIYSLMTITNAFSFSFWYGVCTFMSQSGILVLVLLDLVDFSNNPVETNGVVNRMHIPVDAHMTVRVAQFLGVVLIVNFAAADGDLMKGFSTCLTGFRSAILAEYPEASRTKWYLMGVFQSLAGALLTIDLFILLMQSTKTVGLCLNFAALHFVQDIDDVAFTMGKMGFITRKVQKECNRVGELMVQCKQQRRKDWVRRIFVYVLTFGLYVPYVIVAGWQWTGRFMCKSVYVQFGDLYGDQWPYYSGIFKTPGTEFLGDRISGRAVYISDLDSEDAVQLAYCSKERAWTFSHVAAADECDYFIKSSVTETFDVMDVASLTWFAATPDLGDIPMDWLVLTCSDCNENLCRPTEGECIENECVCHDGRLGLSCEFETKNICPALGLDRRSKGDLATLSFANLFVRKEYKRLEVDVGADTLYDRPIYVSTDQVGNELFVDLFIIFSGYRWIIYGVPQEEISETRVRAFLDFLVSNDPVNRPLETLHNISTDALPYFQPILFSYPVQFGTQAHDVDPSTTRWVLAEKDPALRLIGARPSQNQGVPASFLCSRCDNETTPCLNDGICQENRVCNCTDPVNDFQSYGGFACEYAYTCRDRPCNNGGTCDSVFDVCQNCNPGFYGNLCQFQRKRGAPSVNTVDVFPSGNTNFLCDNTTCLNGGYCTSTIEPCACPENFGGENCDNELLASNASSTIAVNKTVTTFSSIIENGPPASTEGFLDDDDDNEGNAGSFMQGLVNRPGN